MSTLETHKIWKTYKNREKNLSDWAQQWNGGVSGKNKLAGREQWKICNKKNRPKKLKTS